MHPSAIIGNGSDFGDGSHIIYVNGSYKNDSDPVGKLMHDFRCTSSEDMFYPLLAEQVKFFKETDGGRRIMCKAFEELADKRVLEEKKEAAMKFLTKGYSAEDVAECIGLPKNLVEELSKSCPLM